ITINTPAEVDAGDAQTLCAASPDVAQVGSASGGATSGVWSGGAGDFSPDANTLDAVYTPTAEEIAAGTLILTLTSVDPDGDGPCMEVSDTVTITFNEAVEVDAGDAQTLCAASPDVALGGDVSGGTTSGRSEEGRGGARRKGQSVHGEQERKPEEPAARAVDLTRTSDE